jgi:DNA repair protein RadD
MNLRPYQLDAIESARQEIRGGAKKVLLIMPTGGGKTVVFSHVVQSAVSKGSRALVIAHRRELVDQASKKLNAFGVQHGIIQAGFPRALHRPVQVASIQTLMRNPGQLTRVDLLVVDECHHITTTNGYAELLKLFPNALVLGVTATPWRLDGRGLADVFESHVVACTPRELRDEGFLVPVGGWEYEGIDTSTARVKGGDFVASDMQASASSKRVVGDVVSEYLLHANGARAVLFALNVEHSKLMVEAFRAAGVAAEHVDGEMGTAERDAVLARLRSGVTRVVCNCNVLTEGFDCPELECCILARPTLSTALFLQMVGRVLRPSPGKAIARIHDHAGCLAAHGHPYADRDYSPTLTARAPRKKAEGSTPAESRCPACKSVVARWPCDACGYAPKPQDLQVQYEIQEAARRRAIENDGSAPSKPKSETDDERRKKWALRYQWDDDFAQRRAFFDRMVEKHGPSKGAWVYRWVSGNSERPLKEWVEEVRITA